MQVFFWLSAAGVLFAYLGYPLLLMAAGLFFRREVRRAAISPPVSVIITAYNEERRIAAKLENTLALDYPAERMEVIVASDGSTDGTNAVVEGFAPRGVVLLAFDRRRGKEHAQKDAVQTARGEILVFTDVATRIPPDGLKKIVRNFADPTIGCVSSVDRMTPPRAGGGSEGAYVRYEMWLRALESRIHSLVGLSGSFFAARREVCRDFSADMQSDFRTLLNSIKLGLRGVSDPEAFGYYPDIADPSKEKERKVRTVLRGLTVFFRHLELLNPCRYGWFSLQLFCHKLLRWLVPFFMAGAFLFNAAAAKDAPLYLALLLGQCLFYGIGAAASLSPRPPKSPFLKLPSYFLTVNAAIAAAWWRFLKGERVVMWSPSQR
jgi:glycosyltransferase involved in cell wall biosynthesis